MAVPAQERLLRVALLGAGVMLLGALAALSAHGGAGTSGAGDTPTPLTWERALLLLVPLVPLMAGLRMRSASLLLFGVPGSLVLGQPLLATHLDPIVFSVWAIVLVGYIVQSARLLSDVAPMSVALTVRPGRPAEGAPRLRRRARVYDALVALAVIAFLWPLQRALVSGAALPVLATAGLLAALACRAFLLDPLDRHLQRDPGLEDALARLRRHARRGRPASSFYFIALLALVGMALFVLRHRYAS